jgi:hypothetical protein
MNLEGIGAFFRWFFAMLEPLQKRAVERQLRTDLKTLKDLLEAR